MRAEAPDSPALADGAAFLVAAYVHIPFCRRRCPYCDFAVAEMGDGERLTSALVAEIGRCQPFAGPLDAVFFGGGTPSALEPELLGRILESLRHRFGLAAGAEVSLEANPEDLTPALARALVGCGFNRISLGVQSLDDEVLRSLGRGHDGVQGRAALDAARSAFPSVNADLIFGTPGETPESWEASLRGVIESGIDHLSTYALTVERGTALSRSVAAGAPAPDPDGQADSYLMALGVATEAGLVRYETSNFARPGHACVYNLITWAQGEYEGFGNGAHRHRDGMRSRNLWRLDRYLEKVEAGSSPVAGNERVDGASAEVERLMLGLRRAAGVSLGRCGAVLLASPGGKRLLDAGVIAVEGDRLRVSRPLLGDEVSRELLAIDLDEC